MAADHYLIHMSQKKAMLAAGYAKSVSESGTDSVFGRDDVKLYLQQKRDKMSENAGVTADYVISKYKEIVDASLGEVLVRNEDGSSYLDLSLASPGLLYALTGYSADEFSEGRGGKAKKGKRVKVQLANKLMALDSLARHLGMFNDKITVEGKVDLVQRIQQGRERARIKDITEEVELVE